MTPPRVPAPHGGRCKPSLDCRLRDASAYDPMARPSARSSPAMSNRTIGFHPLSDLRSITGSIGFV